MRLLSRSPVIGRRGPASCVMLCRGDVWGHRSQCVNPVWTPLLSESNPPEPSHHGRRSRLHAVRTLTGITSGVNLDLVLSSCGFGKKRVEFSDRVWTSLRFLTPRSSWTADREHWDRQDGEGCLHYYGTVNRIQIFNIDPRVIDTGSSKYYSKMTLIPVSISFLIFPYKCCSAGDQKSLTQDWCDVRCHVETLVQLFLLKTGLSWRTQQGACVRWSVCTVCVWLVVGACISWRQVFPGYWVPFLTRLEPGNGGGRHVASSLRSGNSSSGHCGWTYTWLRNMVVLLEVYRTLTIWPLLSYWIHQY